MGEKKSFVLHKDYNNQIKKLSDEDAAALFRAIFAYVNGEEVAELSPVADMVFSFITAQIDRDNAKYKERCEKSKRAAEARWGNAEKANADSSNKENANACERMPSNAKHADNDNDNDSDNDNDNDNDSDNDNDNDNDNDSDNDVGGDNDISAVFTTFQHCGFQITGYTSEELLALIDEYSAEWVIESLKRAADRGNKTLGYVKGILSSWKNKGAIDNGVAEKKQPEIKPKIDETLDDLDDLF